MFGDVLSFLLVPVIGATIGFSTNVLAIAMLFRPHKQIKLGRFVVPFTPGLIPKEKAQLAKNIGAVLGESVLTPEALANAVATDGVVDAVSAKLGKLLGDFVDDARSIGQMTSETFGISEQELTEQVARRAHGIIDHISQATIPAFIQKAGQGKTVGDVVPPALIQYFKELARTRLPQCADLCRKILQHPTGEQFLRQTITKIVKDNAKGLVGMFINPDKIYNNITEGLLEFLESEAGQAVLAENLDKAIEWLLSQSFDHIPESARIWVAEAVTTLSEHLKANGHVDKIALSILALSPSEIIPKTARERDMAALARPIVVFLAKKAGEHVGGILDIPSIVEEKIGQLDTREMEKLVLSVAGKQLKWIAALGGALGFIIGFIPSIMGMN
ncbi:MAG: DUF445 family protein [Defluviitaleaceae bacterium]|nr:DUF445 family protein [Defluviitaleaceae bacterium]